MADKAKTKKPSHVMVVNAQPHLTHYMGTVLKPGVNRVPAVLADEMAKNPHIKKLADAGKIVISNAPPSTKALEPEEAKALVENTNVPEILDGYREEDSRADVVAAITDKKAEIGPTAVKEE